MLLTERKRNSKTLRQLLAKENITNEMKLINY